MTTWKDMINDQLTTITHIEERLSLNEREKKMMHTIIKRHPMCITSYYFDLIDPQDPKDPIRRLAIPNEDELNQHGTYDTSGEEDNTIMQGVQHKYKPTALVLSTNVCFTYCRFCFRKRMVGYTDDEINRRFKETIHYLKTHDEISNVLISGGDSLALSNHMIEQYLKELSTIDHLDFIRFGTRVPVVFPQRIYLDQELLDLFHQYNKQKQIMIITHFNHPREITETSIKGIKALQSVGVVIRNQTVLLKGVNDHADTMTTLLRKLSSIGVQPYYIFQCRPVKYATGYQVSLFQGIKIINEVKKRLNGIQKAFRYALSHPKGKIEIVGMMDDAFVFKFHQSKYEKHHDHMFIRKVSKDATWLDINLNLIHE